MGAIAQVLGVFKNMLWHEYDAIIYQSGGNTIAKDRAGFAISSCTSGVDDSPVFNAAIQACVAGSTILVRNGNYTVSNSIVIDKMNTRLIGAGGKKSYVYNHMNIVSVGSIDTIQITTNQVKVENLRFGISYNAIHVIPADSSGVNTVTIQGCGFNDTTNYGILLDANTDHIYGPIIIDRCSFGSSGGGPVSEAFIKGESNADNLTDLTISDCLFEDKAKYKIYLKSAGASHLELMEIRGCYMENMNAGGLALLKFECIGSSQFNHLGSIHDNFMYVTSGKILEMSTAGTGSMAKPMLANNTINGGSLDFTQTAGNSIQNVQINNNWLMTNTAINVNGYVRSFSIKGNYLQSNIAFIAAESAEVVNNRHTIITISGNLQRLTVTGNSKHWDNGAITLTATAAVRKHVQNNDTLPDDYPNMASINVKDYGAKGDGITDDRDAINNAVKAAIAKNVQLWFPAGTYKINSKLDEVASGGLRIRGEKGSSILDMSSYVNRAVLQGVTTFEALFYRTALTASTPNITSTITAIPTPAAPTVTRASGSAGANTYGYRITAISPNSNVYGSGVIEGQASAEQTVTTDQATPNNTVVATHVPGAGGYRFYRTRDARGTAPFDTVYCGLVAETAATPIRMFPDVTTHHGYNFPADTIDFYDDVHTSAATPYPTSTSLFNGQSVVLMTSGSLPSEFDTNTVYKALNVFWAYTLDSTVNHVNSTKVVTKTAGAVAWTGLLPGDVVTIAGNHTCTIASVDSPTQITIAETLDGDHTGVAMTGPNANRFQLSTDGVTPITFTTPGTGEQWLLPTSIVDNNTTRLIWMWPEITFNAVASSDLCTSTATTSSATHYLTTGNPVQVRAAGTSGLSTTRLYYVKSESNTTFYLYDTQANALNGGTSSAAVDVANNKLLLTNYFATGETVTMSNVGSVTGISNATTYYIRQASYTGFKLATTNSDGTIVTLGGTGSASFVHNTGKIDITADDSTGNCKISAMYDATAFMPRGSMFATFSALNASVVAGSYVKIYDDFWIMNDGSYQTTKGDGAPNSAQRQGEIVKVKSVLTTGNGTVRIVMFDSALQSPIGYTAGAVTNFGQHASIQLLNMCTAPYHFEGIDFVGCSDGSIQDDYTWAMSIRLYGCTNVVIKDCSFKNFGYANMGFADCLDTLIENCRFKDIYENGEGYSLFALHATDRMLVRGCLFEGIGRHRFTTGSQNFNSGGAFNPGGFPKHIMFRDCKFIGGAYQYANLIDTHDPFDGVIDVENCEFIGSDCIGICCGSVRVVNNRFIAEAVTPWYGPIDFIAGPSRAVAINSTNVKNVLVQGNTFEGFNNAVDLNTWGKGNRGMQVLNNLFDNSGLNIHYYSGNYPTEQIQVNDNIFKNLSGQKTIMLGTTSSSGYCKNWQFNNNMLINCMGRGGNIGGSSITYHAPYFMRITDLEVQGNTFYTGQNGTNYTAGCYPYFYNCNNVRMINNNLTNCYYALGRWENTNGIIIRDNVGSNNFYGINLSMDAATDTYIHITENITGGTASFGSTFDIANYTGVTIPNRLNNNIFTGFSGVPNNFDYSGYTTQSYVDTAVGNVTYKLGTSILGTAQSVTVAAQVPTSELASRTFLQFQADPDNTKDILITSDVGGTQILCQLKPGDFSPPYVLLATATIHFYAKSVDGSAQVLNITEGK